MTAYADLRPPGLNVPFRPGNTVTVTLEWPAGVLTGRTFTSTLGGTPLDVTVTDDTMVVEVTAEQSAAIAAPAEWLLLEDLGGVDPEPIVIGGWAPDNGPNGRTASTVTVTQGGAQVDVTVLPGGVTAATLAAEVDTLEAADAALDARARKLERDPAVGVRRFREQLALARAGGVAASMVVVGDSLTEAYEPSKRGYRWADVVGRRLAGPRLGLGHYVPAAANAFSSRTATDWPGDQMPWVYTGATGGSVEYGADLHATTIAAAGTATISFYGDICTVHYARTPGAPATVTVTLDGQAVAAISPNGTVLPGQAATYGTIGDYGYHTIVLTVGAGGTFTLEGLSWSDNIRFGFGVPFEGVRFIGVGHAGFAVPNFTATSTWAASVAVHGPQCVGIALGANDVNLAPGSGGTPAEYRAGLVTMMEAVDAAFIAVSATPPDYLLIEMPGLPDAWVDAASGACEDFDADRASVLDLGRSASFGGDWGTALAAANDHPNDGGQQWIADRVVDLIDPQGPPIPAWRSPASVFIDPRDVATRRSNWAEALSFGGVTGNNNIAPRILDNSGGGTTVGERRHRVWLEAGTWAGNVMCWQVTGNGVLEVLVAGTSLGTVNQGAVADLVTYFALGTSVTISTPGWYPVVIRKTSASGVANFGGLLLRKTA